jgi:catechol 2,3-dioxygenase-like lactoylglutathione lyase family enzyme
MPKGIFHAVVLTDDLETMIRFLTDVCRIGPVERYAPTTEQLTAAFGWPEGTMTEAALVGQGPGLLDLVGIPAELVGTVAPGVALLAVATPDVEGRVEAARQAGFDPEPPRTGEGANGAMVTLAPVKVGGVGFEFARFG